MHSYVFLTHHQHILLYMYIYIHLLKTSVINIYASCGNNTKQIAKKKKKQEENISKCQKCFTSSAKQNMSSACRREKETSEIKLSRKKTPKNLRHLQPAKRNKTKQTTPKQKQENF